MLLLIIGGSLIVANNFEVEKIHARKKQNRKSLFIIANFQSPNLLVIFYQKFSFMRTQKLRISPQ